MFDLHKIGMNFKGCVHILNRVDRPLVEALEKFIEDVPISFHVPGHKAGVLSDLPLGLRGALRYDLTELEGLDDLHEPRDVIAKAQEKLTALYSSEQSFFLVNGSTVGNLAMIYATCSSGDTVIVQRNVHKSIVNGIELVGAHPVYVTPSWHEESCSWGIVDLAKIKESLSLYPESKAVILTYPTYYGVVSDELKEIISCCHDKKVPVLVDEAHGAHFIIGKPFPASALELGADIVVQSAHKTLPAMTMASFLHIQSKLIRPERVSKYLSMLQSSSPSYLLMASLDDARAFVEGYNESDIHYFLQERKKYIEGLKGIPRLQVLEVDDPLKLILRIDGYSGYEIQQLLATNGIYVELADTYQVLMVLPLLRETTIYPFESVISKIKLAVNRLKVSKDTLPLIETLKVTEGVTRLVHTAKTLNQLEQSWVTYKSSIGRVAAGSVIPYPPGIPLLIAGERITEAHVSTVKSLVQLGAKFHGDIRIDDGHLLVVNEEMEE